MMFKIGICIQNLQRYEEIYFWVMQWATRQSVHADIRKIEEMEELSLSDYDILLTDKKTKDRKKKSDVIIFITKQTLKEDVYERLSRTYKEYLSDEKSYVYYQRPRYLKESLENIIYFTSDKRKIVMHCINGCYEFYDKLNIVEEEVCRKNKFFVRTHQSHLINSKYISKYMSKEVVLTNGEILTISKKRKKKAKEKLSNLSR